MSDNGRPTPAGDGSAPAKRARSVAALAHGMRDALAAIRNAAHLLTLGRDEATAGKVAGVIDRQTERLSGMIDELAEAAKRGRPPR